MPLTYQTSLRGFLLIILMSAFVCAFAQNEHSLGGGSDDPRSLEKVKLKISSELHSKGKTYFKTLSATPVTDQQIDGAELVAAGLTPSSHTITMPPIASQGSEGSCVAFGVAYYARSAEQYYATGAASYATNTNIFSPEYVFNQTKSSSTCGSSYLLIALDLLKAQGVCKWATMPYSWTDGCDTQPTAEQKAEAANYKIANYYRITSSDRAAIKARLLANHPLVLQTTVDNNFDQANASFIWNSYGTALGAHIITLCGYDDSKNAYKVANEWGTSWGDAGYTWIDYDFFPTICYDVFELELVTSAVAPVADAGFDKTTAADAAVNLDGSRSTDTDGYIATYAWTQVSGPNTASIANGSSPVCSVSGWVAGSYVFKLTVTDDDGNTASDLVTVTVTPAEVISCSVTKTTAKGKTTDIVSWNIVQNTQPLSGALEVGSVSKTTNAISYSTLYTISPYSPQGSYSYLVANSKTNRYYRVKIVKSDGSTNYSTAVSIR